MQFQNFIFLVSGKLKTIGNSSRFVCSSQLLLQIFYSQIFSYRDFISNKTESKLAEHKVHNHRT